MNRLPRIAGTTAALMTLLVGSVAVRPAAAAAESAQSIYTRALARERDLRDASNAATLPQLRRTVNTYESLVRQYPTSGYADNALWQAGNLALLAYERFREPSDRRTAVRLFTLLKDGYPSSSLAARAIELLGEVEADPVGAASTAPPVPPVVPPAAAPVPAPVPPAPIASGTIASGPPPDTQRDSRPAEEAVADLVTIRDIKRTSLPDGIRVTIEMDRESMFRAERLENPRRVFFDLRGSRTVPSLQDATLKFTEDIVREIPPGASPQEYDARGHGHGVGGGVQRVHPLQSISPRRRHQTGGGHNRSGARGRADDRDSACVNGDGRDEGDRREQRAGSSGLAR